MKLRNTPYLLAGVLLAALSACRMPPIESPPAEQPTSPSAEAPESPDTTAQPYNQSPPDSEESPPATKTASMSVEGEQSDVTLQRFDDTSLPVVLYYPADDFQPEAMASGEGEGVRFYFSPTGTPDEEAYLSVVFPSGNPSENDVEQLVTGDDGILATNQWEVIGEEDSTSYPWVTKEVIYQEPGSEELYTGTVYVGEHDGQAFYILTHYPAEYGDGFEPRAAMILQNLEFQN